MAHSGNTGIRTDDGRRVELVEDVPMSTPSASQVPAPLPDMYFDGNPADWRRLLAHARVRFIVYAQSFDTDDKRSAFIAAHFRGDALDWLASMMESRTNLLSDFDGFINIVNGTFGLDPGREQAAARIRLDELRQKGGDLLLFLSEFETLCRVVGTTSDASKLALIGGKLDAYYRDSLARSGTMYNSWQTYRGGLLSLYAYRSTGAAEAPSKKRKKATCGKCGKKGHSAGECRSTN